MDGGGFAAARLRKAAAGARWGRGDELASFLCPGASAAGPLRVEAWDEAPDELRPLVFRGHRAFVALRRATPRDEAERGALLLEFSAGLRKDLDACLARLERRAEQSGQQELQGYVDKLKVASAVWHLSETLVLDVREQAASRVAAWAFQHYPRYASPRGRALERLDARNKGSDSAAFWPALFDLALRGDLVSAWTLLARESRFKTAAQKVREGCAGPSDEALVYMFKDLRDVMLRMPRLAAPEPVLDVADEDDLADWRGSELAPGDDRRFGSMWTVWRDKLESFSTQCEVVLEQLGGGEGEYGGQLRVLLKLLKGDLAATQEQLSGELDTWQHLLAALLLYQAPLIRKDEIRSLVSQIAPEKGSASPADDARVHEMLMCAFDLDMHRVIQLLHDVVGDRWVEAHLAEALAQAGAIESVSVNTQAESDLYDPANFALAGLEMDLREHFIVQYAMQLGLGGRQKQRNAHFPASWRLAADYLVALDRPVRVPSVRHGEPAAAKHVLMPLGLPYMERIMDAQQPVSDAHFTQLLRGCSDMQIDPASLLRERVVHWWCHKGGRLKYKAQSATDASGDFVGAANALLWASRSGLEPLADRLLRIIFEKASVATLDLVVEHLSSGLVAASRGLNETAVSFLAKYYDLHGDLRAASNRLEAALERLPKDRKPEHLESPAVKELLEEAFLQRDRAARQLCGILGDEIVPKRFYLPLLRKVLLWEKDRDSCVLRNPPCLLVHQASMLQGCLEEPMEKSLSPAGADAPEPDKAVMRLILAQCLARAALVA